MNRFAKLAVVAILSAAAGVAHAEGSDSGSGGAGGDSGDNSMSVRYGASWFALQGGDLREPVIDVRIAAPASQPDARAASTRFARNPFRDDTAA